MSGKPSVLLVDDDHGMIETITDILSEYGYRVEIASSGEEAVRLAVDQPFDIVLMDIKMEGINGVEAMRLIKQQRPATEVILMTAYSVNTLIEEAHALGVKSVLRKPFQFEEVLSHLQAYKQTIELLIVDDEEIFLQLLKKKMESSGFNVTAVGSGEEALERAKAQRFDVALIDMMLPGINGYETHVQLKKINPNLQAILMTGYQDQFKELIRKSIAEDARICLNKPFRFEELLRVIRGITEDD